MSTENDHRVRAALTVLANWQGTTDRCRSRGDGVPCSTCTGRQQILDDFREALTTSPAEVCSTCGGSFDSPPCSLNRDLGWSGHTKAGGTETPATTCAGHPCRQGEGCRNPWCPSTRSTDGGSDG